MILECRFLKVHVLGHKIVATDLVHIIQVVVFVVL